MVGYPNLKSNTVAGSHSHLLCSRHCHTRSGSVWYVGSVHRHRQPKPWQWSASSLRTGAGETVHPTRKESSKVPALPQPNVTRGTVVSPSKDLAGHLWLGLVGELGPQGRKWRELGFTVWQWSFPLQCARGGLHGEHGFQHAVKMRQTSGIPD